MQVIKVDKGLALLLPKAVVEELGLKEGDDVSALSLTKDTVKEQKAIIREEFLRQLEQFRFPLPDDYKFDRDEANER
ncbi:Transcriptional regulator/antitoxin, MazE [Bradyrhizobium sp. STM 3843]|uniref:AbrB/MazE/SpoVT family DNA-binding domain-containing protein n=1 Tax=Bradyrhizobium sp. STM 3843 TaxID=551947 RepID=UPI000240B0B9|nr:AbrB/MazE/SpoVT family DNA-binding domain-containing protein [Bradyrhizobium sp. STM 3843]CCE07198.1 Transcriptional regulator/antitoxin, MazE [Bradyrhizobium sp. STM 3843]